MSYILQQSTKTLANVTYVRSKTKVKNSVGPLLNDNGELVSNDQKMAEILNKIFAKVFTRDDCDHLPKVKNVFCAELAVFFPSDGHDLHQYSFYHPSEGRRLS